MRVIIAGSRTIWDYPLLTQVIRASGLQINEVVSGGAKGIDHLGQRWAAMKRLPCSRFPAEWKRYGKAAGPRRNRQMAAYADALLLVWDGKSRGSADMLEAAQAAGLLIYEYRTEGAAV
jgi:predicted Rossmann fold nucleotide-binding protein DprA/Smf involved in DNA uptake